MRERWQIYQLTIPTIPPGGRIGVPLTLDSDAPFALRMIKSRNIGLNGFRFQNARKQYQSNFLRTDTRVERNGGQGSNYYPTHGLPVYPQEIYSPNSQIIVDVGNDNAETDLVDARLIFYGSKLFADSASSAKDYPAQIAPFPFIYPLTNSNGLNDGPVSIGLATSPTAPATIRDLQLRVMQDADFVLRYMVCDPFYLLTEGGAVPRGVVTSLSDAPANWRDLRVIVKDESRKPFMNEPIAIDDVFGQAIPEPFGANTDGVGVGPNMPGLVTPELIIEKQHSLYFDLFRYDLTGAPLDLWFRFHGAKLFKGQ